MNPIGVDTGIAVVTIPPIEQNARRRARLTLEVDEQRVRRPIVRQSYLI
jgi:hypothetical protein